MSPDFPGRVLAELHALNSASLSPSDARAHFEERITPPTGVRVELLWERHPASERLEYGALIEEGEVTHSLRTHAPHSFPWVLRDAIRWSDGDVLRVNARTTRVEDVMARLDLLWADLGLSAKLVHASLMEDACAELQLSVTATELQEAVDGFRIDRGLRTYAETEAWLKANGLTHERLEAVLEFQCLAQKLKSLVLSREANHATPGPSLFVALRARFASEGPARAFVEELGAPSSLDSFTHLALRDGTPLSFVEMDPSQLPNPKAGVPTPPLPSGRHWDVFLPVRAASGSATNADAAFAQWLQQRAARADITWLWGPDSVPAGSLTISTRTP